MMTEKNRRFYVAKCQYARKRARMRVCVFFYIKCSIWPETYVKQIWDDLEHLKKIRARKRANKSVRAFLRAFFDLKLIGQILTLIMINMNEKWISVLKI